jgi:phenylacetate-coenzyme A ligase PaaK-like adenylate-forming protein
VIERQVQLILDFKPDVITPSYLLVVLDEFRARGVDPSETIARDCVMWGGTLDQCDACGNREQLQY